MSMRAETAARRLAPVAAILALAVAVAYLPLGGSGFVNFDDDRLILDNPVLRDLSPGGLGDLLRHQLFTPHYKPLVNLSWAVELGVFGPQPRVFHGHNLLLHLLNTMLVLGLAVRLAPAAAAWRCRIGWAAVVAGLWALHPMKVESVAWAAERKDLLFAAFYLGAMLAYLRWVDGRRRRWLVASALLGLGGVLSKSTAITLPLALLLVDLVRQRHRRRAVLTEKLPHLAVAALALYLYGLLPGPGEAGASLTLLAGGDATSRLVGVAHRHVAFAAHWLAPVDLAVLYPVPEFLVRPRWPLPAVYAMAHLALLGALLAALRRSPLTAAALLFYSLTLLPTLVAPISTTNYLSDRYTYLPSLGLATLAVLGAEAVRRRRPSLGPALKAVAAAVLVLCGLLTYRQVGIWRDSLRLWDHVLASRPPHPFAYNNRGVARLLRGDEDGALADFNLAIAARPAYAAALANRGDLMRRRGQPAAAVADLDRAVALEPRHGRLYRSRGLAKVALDRLDEALADYDRALALDPADGEALYLRAQAHRRRGDLAAARADVDAALAVLDAPAANVHLLRALIRARQGDLRGALLDTTHALELAPTNAVALNNRGFLRLRLDDPAGALADLDRALALRPAYPLAHRSRGDALAALGRPAAACAAWRAAANGGAPATVSRLADCPHPAADRPPPAPTPHSPPPSSPRKDEGPHAEREGLL